MTTYDLQLRAQTIQSFVDAALINSQSGSVTIPAQHFRKFADNVDTFLADSMQEICVAEKFKGDLQILFRQIVNMEIR